VLCAAGSAVFWGRWSSYFPVLFAVLCASYAVWNAGLTYVLDGAGLTRSTRWGTKLLVRWTDVSRKELFERGMTLVFQRRDGSRLVIRCGELPDPDAFINDVDTRVPPGR